jgi:hypothetical protein
LGKGKVSPAGKGRPERVDPFCFVNIIGELKVLESRMSKWLHARLGIIKATLPRPIFLLFFGVLQVGWLLLAFSHSVLDQTWAARIVQVLPWYAWILLWLVLFSASSIEYSLERKENFDKTSRNFFKAYLGFTIREGHQLFKHSEEDGFYSKVSHWQRRAIEGIGIGLGHQASEEFFHKMESQASLEKAYKESIDLKINEPLCQALQMNLEELELIGRNLPFSGEEREEWNELTVGKEAEGPKAHPSQPMLPPGL